MDEREQTLVGYPYVVVRIGCDFCGRKGGYRLARLAAKFGAEITLGELLKRITADCWANATIGSAELAP